MPLNFETDKLVKELKKKKPKKVLLQLPEGIKRQAFDIVKQIEKLGIEVVVLGETCWGGCSIGVEEAKSLGCDLIVHFGHAEFIKTNFPVIYIEVKDELDLLPLLKKSVSKLEDYKTLGLSYAVQHKQDIEKVIEFYEKQHKKIILSSKKGHSVYEGHIIGCEYSGLKEIEKQVDAFLVLGNNFHSLGASLFVNKPVILLDVYNNEIKNMAQLKEKIIKQRFLSIQKLKSAKNVGIIIETKPGQKFGSPNTLIKKLKDKGKNVIVISMNELTPDKLMNFYNVDCFIELGCPRIAVDDFFKYKTPIVTYKEALVALGGKSWNDLLEEGFW